MQDKICPIQKANYHYVGGKCLYLETVQLNYSRARSNCKQKFKGNGRLFEPTDLTINEKVHKIAMQVYLEVFGDRIHWKIGSHRGLMVGYAIWIGVNDLTEQGKYIYDNSAVPVTMEIPWAGSLNLSSTRPGRCIEFILVNKPKWIDFSCSEQQLSICEKN